MGKFLKIILSLVTIIVTAIIITAIVLPLYIDPNDFKPEIETAIKKATGRQSAIEGDLDLSVFPWLGVSTGKMILDNAAGFSEKTFAEIEAGEIKVKLLPLLSKKLEVNRIVLKGLRLNLQKNTQGVSNWADLKATDSKTGQQKKTDSDPKTVPSKSDQEEPPMLAAIAISGITLEDAFIIWDDRQKDQHVELQKLNLTTDTLKFDDPVDIDLSVTIVTARPAITEQLELSTALTINEALNVFALNDFKIESSTVGKQLPGSKIISEASANIAVDLVNQNLKIPDLKLALNALNLTGNLTGTQILDKPQINGPIKIAEFNVREFLQQLNVELPDMQDPSSLGALSMQFDLASTSTSAKLKQLKIKLDESSINGHLDVTQFDPQKIAFNLDVDRIDIDRYLKGKTSTSEKTTNRTDKKPQPVIPATTAASAGLLPLKALRELNAEGQLTIGQLKINGLNMQGIVVKLQADKGLITTSQQVKRFYQGQYTGNTRINARTKNPTLSVNEKLANVQLGPLLKDLDGNDRITGTTHANANLSGRGNTLKAIKSSLNGNLDVKIKEGYVKGFNLKKILDNSQSLLQGQPLPTSSENDKSEFSEITASAKITNGIIKNDDLFAKSSKLRVNGKGTANLKTEALDYNVITKLIRREATATEPEKIEGIPVAINIGGTFAKPSYTVDVTSILLEKNKAKIEEKKQEIYDKIDKKLGDKLGEQLGKDAGELFKKLF